MKTYAFVRGTIPPPSMFHQGRVTKPIEADGRVNRMRFECSDDLPPVGTMMRLTHVDNVFCAVALVDWEAEERRLQAEREARWAAEEAEEAEKERLRAERATKFNEGLGLPVAFSTAYKVVLNGCYEGNGSGSNRRTVDHVLLDESVTVGRIFRTIGQLLCSADPGSFGTKKNDRPYPVTCKACLRIAAKFSATQKAA
jgi:hypothetical protein